MDSQTSNGTFKAFDFLYVGHIFRFRFIVREGMAIICISRTSSIHLISQNALGTFLFVVLSFQYITSLKTPHFPLEPGHVRTETITQSSHGFLFQVALGSFSIFSLPPCSNRYVWSIISQYSLSRPHSMIYLFRILVFD